MALQTATREAREKPLEIAEQNERRTALLEMTHFAFARGASDIHPKFLRATGPHLHWSVMWRDARLDPMLLVAAAAVTATAAP